MKIAAKRLNRPITVDVLTVFVAVVIFMLVLVVVTVQSSNIQAKRIEKIANQNQELSRQIKELATQSAKDSKNSNATLICIFNFFSADIDRANTRITSYNPCIFTNKQTGKVMNLPLPEQTQSQNTTSSTKSESQPTQPMTVTMAAPSQNADPQAQAAPPLQATGNPQPQQNVLDMLRNFINRVIQ